MANSSNLCKKERNIKTKKYKTKQLKSAQVNDL